MNHPKKKKLKIAVSFAIVSKNKKYQGVDLIKELKYVSWKQNFSGGNKIPKQMKTDTVKRTLILQMIQDTVAPIKIPMTFFRKEKAYPELLVDFQGAQNNIEKQN